MRRSFLTVAVAGVVIPATWFLSSGCHRSMTTQEVSTTQEAATPPDDVELVAQGLLKGGAQLWAENCIRCHNYRPPRERSDRGWEIIVHHMRVRANLTAVEHRLILAFLKSAN